MTTYNIGPLTVDVQTRELEEVLTGLRVALRRRGDPIDPDRIPEGWHLQQRHEERVPWPSEWTRRTGYWLSIWSDHEYGAHITIKPYDGAWTVEYDPENSWMGGDALGRGFTFEESVTVAIDGMERINDGATQRDLWMDYKDWGEDNA